MTTQIYQKRMIERRKINVLCIGCGKLLDREGVHCITCREKINKATRERRHWYQDNGICPRCEKNSIMGDEKVCPECNAKFASRASKIRESNREEYNKKQRVIHKNIHNNRKEQGICTRCGKRKADEGYRTCGICQAKTREYKRIKYGKPDRSARFEQGLCYFCDNLTKDGYKVCEHHYQMNLKKLDNGKCRKATEEIKKIENRRIKNKEKSYIEL